MKPSTCIALAFLIGLVVICGGLAIASRCASISPERTATPSGASSNRAITLPRPTQLPDNVFDTEVSIRNSSVTFSYPLGGFYGFGAEIKREEPYVPFSGESPETEINQITVSSTAYHGQNGGALNQLTIGATKNVRGATIQDIVAAQPLGLQKQSVLVTINNRVFSVYKMPYSISTSGWSATTVDEKEVVTVIFNFKPGDDSISYSAYNDSDRLFFQILSRIKF